MKRKLKIATLVAFALFALLQFYQPSLNKDGGKMYDTDFSLSYNIPADVQSIFKTSCYDCHSHNTNYMWYDYIQPARSFVENHISEAKEELNFNEWVNYSGRKQERLLASIKKQIETKEMPLHSYVWMHQNAKLSDADIKIMTDWLEKAIINAE